MKNPKDEAFRSRAQQFAYDHRNDGQAGKGDAPRYLNDENYRNEIDRIFKHNAKSKEKN